ncbi:uncharacterized protein EMH_0092130 [Eimeria mitis]|uniref:Uncharacterized protein n=1 Tax=Eimeria mitis TaxID=44415 RepID=U6KK25_9EIME|nr:uncharacterized protein EMH_0092130 [Eimeria mitis]CDJ35808.1 hypothetical protein, conserved [Eimeria mitis]
MAHLGRTRDQVQEFSLQDVPAGKLAWTHCAEEGFVTVKILKCDVKTGKAQVVLDAEGASSVAAAQAAADAVRETSSGPCTTAGNALFVEDESKAQDSQHRTESSAGSISSGKRTKLRKEKLSTPWSLESPEAATEAFADPLSQRGAHGLSPRSCLPESETDDDESEGLSDAPRDPSSGTSFPVADVGECPVPTAEQLEHRAAAAAAAAADAVSAKFISQPPFEVPVNHLWPYSAPPRSPSAAST